MVWAMTVIWLELATQEGVSQKVPLEESRLDDNEEW